MDSKKGGKEVQRRYSKHLVEQAMLAKLRSRKAAHGDHEVGNTSEDPLAVLSEGKEGVIVHYEAEQKENPHPNHDYDSDYMQFLAEMYEMIDKNSITGASPAADSLWEEVCPSSPFEAPTTPPQAKARTARRVAHASKKK